MAKRQRSKGTGTLYQRDGRGPFIARWYDESGRRREASTGTTDRRTADRILSARVARAALRKEGVVDARADAIAQAGRHPIDDHLADFIAGVAASGVTAQQVQQLETRLSRLLKLAGIDAITDISVHSAQMAIGDIRKGDKKHKAASVQTAIHYQRAMKQFTKWLVRDNRLASDPLAGMASIGNPETDRKHVRRELSDEELSLLVHAAENGKAVRKMSGLDRAMMYRVAIGTGFRANEVRSLTPESFDLRADPPTVTLGAASSKHRREDVQPIRLELANLLMPWLKGKPAGKPVFPYKGKAVNLMKADLLAARKAWIAEARNDAEQVERQKSSFLLYKDHAGTVADFHSFRHTFVSKIVASRASVKVAMQLARHQSAELTVGRYAHARLHDLTGALSALPCPAPMRPETEPEELSATGTDDVAAKCDQEVDDHRLYPRQLGREAAGSDGNERDTTPVLGPQIAVFRMGAKKSPGRGNRGHRLAIACPSSDPSRGKPGFMVG